MYVLHTSPQPSLDQEKAKKYVLVEIEISITILNERVKSNIAYVSGHVWKSCIIDINTDINMNTTVIIARLKTIHWIML